METGHLPALNSPLSTVPTTAQSARLYTLASRAGLDHAGVLAEVFDRYGVETTRELTDRQYEEYTRDLDLRAAGRTAGAAAPKPGAIHDKAGCEALLRELWPQLFQTRCQLALALVEVMDWCRLNRQHGRVSVGKLTHMIEGARKFDLDIIGEAVRVYLQGYTHTDERYFLGICRRLAHDAALQRARAKCHPEEAHPTKACPPAARRDHARSTQRGSGAVARPQRPAAPSPAVDAPRSTLHASRPERLRHLASRLPEGSAFRRHIEARADAIERGLPDPGPTPPATPLSEVIDDVTPREEE
jgi:hypothetical protein